MPASLRSRLHIGVADVDTHAARLTQEQRDAERHRIKAQHQLQDDNQAEQQLPPMQTCNNATANANSNATTTTNGIHHLMTPQRASRRQQHQEQTPDSRLVMPPLSATSSEHAKQQQQHQQQQQQQQQAESRTKSQQSRSQRRTAGQQLPVSSPLSEPQESPRSSPSPLSPTNATESALNLLRPHTHLDPTTNESRLLIASPNKWTSAWVRTYTTMLMLAGFLIIISSGHHALVLLVVSVQIAMFREIKRLSRVLSHRSPLESFRPLHWYWFATAFLFTWTSILASPPFNLRIPYRTFVSFSLYSIGIATFVLSLRRGYYRYQFEMFAWIHLTLLIVVVQSTFIIINIYAGLIWFILPALLIISNDTFAYVFGFFFGKTPLIKLSPKKTWEGFLGGFAMTLVVGFVLGGVLSPYQAMTCPKTDLTWQWPVCEPADPFVRLPIRDIVSLDVLPLAQSLHLADVQIFPMQLHSMMLAIFASLIAPFGGFFASGFKRAFHIKDFGESIPGHGGVTDRMDCQIMMGLFVYVYYNNFVHPQMTDEQVNATLVDRLMQSFAHATQHQQLAIYRQITQKLVQSGLLANVTQAT